MPTERTELSKKNKYWIPKHRYLELKHFCKQYEEWKEDIRTFGADILPSGIDYSKVLGGSGTGDPTAAAAIADADAYMARRNIDLIERTAIETDPDLAKYIIWNVTEGTPYWNLSQLQGMPCSKRTFIRRRQKFFWLLSKKRDNNA